MGFSGQGWAGRGRSGGRAGRGGAGLEADSRAAAAAGEASTAAEREAEREQGGGGGGRGDSGGSGGGDSGERGADAAGARQGARVGTRRERHCGGAGASRARGMVERGDHGPPRLAPNALQPWAREAGSSDSGLEPFILIPEPKVCGSVRCSRSPGLSPDFIPFPDDSLHPPTTPTPKNLHPPELFFRRSQSYPLGVPLRGPLLPIFLQTQGVDEARPGPMHTWPLLLPPATQVLSQHTNCCAQDLASAASTPHTRTPTWSPTGGDFSKLELWEQFDPLPKALVSGQTCFLVDTPILFAS